MDDEAVELKELLLRIVTLESNPFPFYNTIYLLLTKKQLKILGDCIYKYLGEHYPESSIAQIQQIVKMEVENDKL